MRIFLQYVLPLLIPFIGFFAYRLLVLRGRGFLKDTPWYSLTLGGLLLVIGGLVSIAIFGGSSPDGTYIPPRYEDGRIVPSEVRTDDEGS